MAFAFRRKLFRKPNKQMHYFLAFAALLLVLLLVGCWAVIRHNRENALEDNADASSSNAAETAFTIADKGHLLCIIADAHNTRFFLLQGDPAQNAVYCTPIPPQLTMTNGKPLIATYNESGAAHTTAILADMLSLPLKQYVTATPKSAAKWLARAQDGIPLTLAAPVIYTAEDSVKTTIPAGHLVASATQAAMLLHHSDETGAQVFVSLLNQYLRENRHITADFSALCNLTKTNLRIDNLTAYRNALSHLATVNEGAICTTIPLPTKTSDGKLILDNHTLKRTALYR